MKRAKSVFAIASVVTGLYAPLSWAPELPPPAATAAAEANSKGLPLSPKEVRELLRAQTAVIKSLAARVTALEARVQELEAKKGNHHE
jgi:hypothetical protein